VRVCNQICPVSLHTPRLSSLLSLLASRLSPHSSLLTPHSSLLTPHSSLLTPHSSLLTPFFSLSSLLFLSSLLSPCTRMLPPLSSLSHAVSDASDPVLSFYRRAGKKGTIQVSSLAGSPPPCTLSPRPLSRASRLNQPTSAAPISGSSSGASYAATDMNFSRLRLLQWPIMLCVYVCMCVRACVHALAMGVIPPVKGLFCSWCRALLRATFRYYDGIDIARTHAYPHTSDSRGQVQQRPNTAGNGRPATATVRRVSSGLRV